MSASSSGALPTALRTRSSVAARWAAGCSRDEGRHPPGSPQAWPAELRNAVATMLASRAQVVIF